MTYTPNPSDITNPTTAAPAGSMAAEFVALKTYIKDFLSLGRGRNLLANSAFNIDQVLQGTAAYTIAAGGTSYTVDQWLVIVFGSTGATAQRVSGGMNPNGYCLNTIFAGSTTSAYISQRIAAGYCGPLVTGAVISVSGWVYSSSNSPVLTPSVVAAGGVNNFSTTTTVGTGTPVTLVAGQYTYFSQQITLTGSAQNGIQLLLAFTNTAGVTINLSQMQMELNSWSTPYEYVDPATELSLCQRYLYYGSLGYAGYGVAGDPVTLLGDIQSPFILPSPTIATFNSVYTNCSLGTISLFVVGARKAVNLNVNPTATGALSFYTNYAISSQL